MKGICLCGKCETEIIKTLPLPDWVIDEINWMTDALDIDVDLTKTGDDEYREYIEESIRNKLGDDHFLAADVVSSTQQLLGAKLNLIYRHEKPYEADGCTIDIANRKFHFIKVNH